MGLCAFLSGCLGLPGAGVPALTGLETPLALQHLDHCFDLVPFEDKVWLALEPMAGIAQALQGQGVLGDAPWCHTRKARGIRIWSSGQTRRTTDTPKRTLRSFCNH